MPIKINAAILVLADGRKTECDNETFGHAIDRLREYATHGKQLKESDHIYRMDFAGATCFVLVEQPIVNVDHQQAILKNIVCCRDEKQFKNICKNPGKYTADLSKQKVEQVQQAVAEAKEGVIKNIDRVLDRGGKIEEVVVKAEELDRQAVKFKREAQGLNVSKYWDSCCCGFFSCCKCCGCKPCCCREKSEGKKPLLGPPAQIIN